MKQATINVSRDFSKFPGGRVRGDGPFSGQRFREECLVPQLRNVGVLTVELDGVLGYGSSFLEEAFGGLVRELRWGRGEAQRKLQFKSNDEILVREIWRYMDEATSEGMGDVE